MLCGRFIAARGDSPKKDENEQTLLSPRETDYLLVSGDR